MAGQSAVRYKCGRLSTDANVNNVEKCFCADLGRSAFKKKPEKQKPAVEKSKLQGTLLKLVDIIYLQRVYEQSVWG